MQLKSFAAVLTLVAFTICPAAPATPTECAAHLTALGVTQEEARYWSRRARSRDAFFAATSMLQMAEHAPNAAWDLLALTRLSEIPEMVPLADEVVDLLAKYPGVGELEILFDTELRSLRPTISGLVALGRLGPPEVKEWLTEVMRVPARLFVLSRVLDDFPAATYDPARGLIRTRGPVSVRLILTRARRWLDADKSFRTVIRSSRLMAEALIRAQFHRYKTEKGAVVDDAEAMTEWALDKLVPGDGHRAYAPDPLPAHWPKFYARLFDAIDAAPHRQKKEADGFTAGEKILYALLNNGVHEITNVQLKKHGRHDQWTAGSMLTDWVVIAFGGNMVNPVGGAHVVAMLADAVGATFPHPSELKKQFAARLRARMGDALREYYPLAGRGPNADLDPVEPVTEPSEPIPLELAVAAEATSCPIPTTDHGVDDLPTFASVVENCEYRVNFARPHAKFTGTQRVVFTRHALHAMAEHLAVPPDTWLEALRMGMALPNGQRGVKVLGFGCKRGTPDGLPVHIKLVLSNYRVTGDFCEGVWTFDDLIKEH